MGLMILIGLFATCVVVGVPVAFALGIAALAAIAYEGLPLLIGFQRIISGVNVFSLMAIPFFIFAGELMFHGGIAERLVRFASAAVGRVRTPRPPPACSRRRRPGPRERASRARRCRRSNDGGPRRSHPPPPGPVRRGRGSERRAPTAATSLRGGAPAPTRRAAVRGTSRTFR